MHTKHESFYQPDLESLHQSVFNLCMEAVIRDKQIHNITTNHLINANLEAELKLIFSMVNYLYQPCLFRHRKMYGAGLN